MASYNAEPADGDGDLTDFSCYITINNLSDEDFLLSDFGIIDGYGVWPAGMPLNTIDAHTAPQIQLKDPKLIGGSEGWLEYEVPIGDSSQTFRLEFADPESPFSKNYLRAKTDNDDVIHLTVQPYKTSGHPFYAQVDVKVTGPKSTSLRYQRPPLTGTSENIANIKYPPANNSFQAKYDIGFESDLPIANKPPVHETIAIAAFIQSKKPLPKGTTYHNLNDKQWEYFRGLVWNDDPSCYLFDDYTKKNHDFSTGIAWYNDFENGPPSCMIRRSHFGDLQFLHAMGAGAGEEPAETQRKLLKWIEVMYKLACGNQGVSDTDQLKQTLGEWFNADTKPTDQETMRGLILASTPNYYQTNIQWRALGVCLHLISDSYAVGHTQRRLRNPDSYQGRDSKGYMVFKPGTWGDWGAVINFHHYDGQNSDRHSHYDGLEGVSLPVPKDLDSFNSIIGARNAIEGCKKLINFWADAVKWEDGVETFLKTEVFALDKDVSPSNNQVDEAGPVSLSCRSFTGGDMHSEYQVGLQRKLANLEIGASTTGTSVLASMRPRPVWRAVLFTFSILALAAIFTFVGIHIRGLM